jgi:hypothetical protein
MGRFVRVGLTLATIVSIAALSGPTAGAATSRHVFDVHVGDHFIPPLASPDVAVAENGDTLSARVTGVFDADSKTASGSGTFEHRAFDGSLQASGTLTITGLTAFQFFGCGSVGGAPLPPSFCGGRAILTVVAHPAPGVSVDAILTVTCDATDAGPPPPGHPEGITVEVPGHLNFNKPLSGNNILVMH